MAGSVIDAERKGAFRVRSESGSRRIHYNGARMRKLVAAIPAGAWSPLLVAIAAIVPYLDALGGGFVSDARPMIQDNSSLLESKSWLVWFLRDYYWGSPLQDVTLYRPLTVLSYLLHVRTTGAQALPFLLGNVLLHAAVSLLVLRLGQRLVGDHGALVGAAVFAVHPLHTEAVAWIMGRSELLAALFGLASCLAWLRALDPAARRPLACAIGASALYLAASLSKEHAVLLPVWAAFAAMVSRPRRASTLAAGLAGTALALATFLALRSYALAREPEMALDPALYNPASSVAPPLRWLSAAAVAARYAFLFVWPARLSHDYSFAQIPASTGIGLLEAAGILLVVGLGASLFLSARRGSGIALALAICPVTFFLVSNVPFPIGTIMAERLTYLPSAGLALVAGSVASARLRASDRGRRVATLVVAAALVALAGRTLARNLDWRDDGALYSSALRISPRSAQVLMILSDRARARGDLTSALDLAERALRIYPGSYQGRITAGRIRVERREYAPAAREFRWALELAPKDDRIRGQIHNNLGNLLAQEGRVAEAEAELREAIRLGPDDLIPRVALVELLLSVGRNAEARQQLADAALGPARQLVLLPRLASAALAAGDPKLATSLARRASEAGIPVRADLLHAMEKEP